MSRSQTRAEKDLTYLIMGPDPVPEVIVSTVKQQSSQAVEV